MSAKLRKTLAVSSFALVCALALTVSGCKEDKAPSNPPQAQNPTYNVPGQPRVTVDPMPESSPEQAERHIWDGNGKEIERQITYRVTFNVETIKYRSDGKKASSRMETPRGTVLAELQYDADGTTIVSGFQKRLDGTMLFEVSRDATGATTTNSYWWDGKGVFMILRVEQNGAYTAEMHHKDGSLWMKRSGPRVGDVAREEFYANNRLQSITEPNGATLVISTVRPDGTIKAKQTVSIMSNYWGGRSYSVASVEEYAADGKTLTRKITIDRNGGYSYSYGYSKPSVVEEHRADGTVVTYQLRSTDQTVSREEIRDAGGKLISSKDYGSNDADRPKVEIDSSLVNAQSTDDPVQRYQNAEKYDSYRDPLP